jgi:hypothetical protein
LEGLDLVEKVKAELVKAELEKVRHRQNRMKA